MSKNKINKNSRFASLMEEKTIKKNNNVPQIKQTPPPVMNKYTHSSKQLRQEELTRIKLKKEKIDLAPESFPELVKPSSTSNNDETNLIKSSFIEKLNSVVVVENVDVDFKNLELGWISIKKDIFTGKKVIQEKKFEEKPTPPVVVDKTHQINTILEKAYETRTSKYIDMWGHDMWEQMFIIPDYDYDYFEDLDELDDEENELTNEEEYCE